MHTTISSVSLQQKSLSSSEEKTKSSLSKKKTVIVSVTGTHIVVGDCDLGKNQGRNNDTRKKYPQLSLFESDFESFTNIQLSQHTFTKQKDNSPFFYCSHPNYQKHNFVRSDLEKLCLFLQRI